MKTFRELKAGDKVYVINEGTNVGYIRIEEYILEEPLTEHPEKIKGTYVAKQKNCSWPLIIHETLLDETNCGFIFTNLEEASELYIKKSEDIMLKIQKKYNEIMDEAKSLHKDIMLVGKNYGLAKAKKFDKLIISKQYNENN